MKQGPEQTLALNQLGFENLSTLSNLTLHVHFKGSLSPISTLSNSRTPNLCLSLSKISEALRISCNVFIVVVFFRKRAEEILEMAQKELHDRLLPP